MSAESQAGRIAIVEVSRPARLREFVELPYRLYATDPRWIPELRRDAVRRLSPEYNPFLAHAEMALFLARRADGSTCGRIAAIEDRAHNDVHTEQAGWFGFFEAADAASAGALLEAVERWAIARGARVIRGPVNPSLNDTAGLLVDGFDEPPYLLMPYNPRVYAEYIEGEGFRKAKDLWAWDLDLTRPLGGRIVRLAGRARRRSGVRVRTVDMRAYDDELGRLLDVYREAWEDNWGFVPPTQAEVRQFADDLKPVIDPEIVLIAEIDGRVAGCVVTLPDVNQVLARMGGSLLPFGLWHFLRRRRIIDRARVVLLGVLPAYRRAGLYPLLVEEVYRRGIARGYRRAELSWTLEDNDEINAGIAASGGRHYKTYRLYEKPIG
ncbi:MAG: GNAT family N-acetyltransferase [Acidobacteria bacterium]|nr:GNAT family N-acetyltransferase [Acidobacteriota bacterium]